MPGEHFNAGNQHAAKPESEKLRANVLIRTAYSEAEAWAQAAEAEGVSRSAWLRALANAEIERRQEQL